MDVHLQFTFRNKKRKASAIIDYKEDPCIIFVFLTDEDLIKEFGDEVSIRTDCENILPAEYSYPELDELKTAIFDATKLTIEFARAKAEYPKSPKWPSQRQAI